MTKPNEMKPKQTKSNGLKQNKDHPLLGKSPLSVDESLEMLTKHMRDNRKCAVNVVSYRVQDGRLILEHLPDGVG